MIENWNDSDTQRIVDGFGYMPSMQKLQEVIESEPICVHWREEDGESEDYVGFVEEIFGKVYSALWNKFR